MEQDKPVELPAVDDADEGDHPDEVTEVEAEEGLMVYKEIDDLDDDSNGLDE